MPDLQYRLATIDDLDSIIELSALAYGEFQKELTPENWAVYIGGIRNRERINDLMQISKCTVCLDEDRIVGVTFFVPSGKPKHQLFEAEWSYVRLLGVHPEYRGRGIAQKLMEYCLAYAKEGGEKTIALHTSEFMDAARHIYEQMGFRVLKEVAGLYDKQYWIYTLDLR